MGNGFIVEISNSTNAVQEVNIFSGTLPDGVVVEAMNEKGDTFKLEAHGLLSVCIQHEMDHLLGKVFVEYLSPLKRTRIKNKMLKQQRNRPM